MRSQPISGGRRPRLEGGLSMRPVAAVAERAVEVECWWLRCLLHQVGGSRMTLGSHAARAHSGDQIRVSGRKAAHANQKYSPEMSGSSASPLNGPALASPSKFQVLPVS
jgi:hypothetical protein